VPGFDLVRNWGKTPTNLRPLFALMERLSGIDGAGRIFATIAKRESAFVATALNCVFRSTWASVPAVIWAPIPDHLGASERSDGLGCGIRAQRSVCLSVRG